MIMQQPPKRLSSSTNDLIETLEKLAHRIEVSPCPPLFLEEEEQGQGGGMLGKTVHLAAYGLSAAFSTGSRQQLLQRKMEIRDELQTIVKTAEEQLNKSSRRDRKLEALLKAVKHFNDAIDKQKSTPGWSSTIIHFFFKQSGLLNDVKGETHQIKVPEHLTFLYNTLNLSQNADDKIAKTFFNIVIHHPDLQSPKKTETPPDLHTAALFLNEVDALIMKARGCWDNDERLKGLYPDWKEFRSAISQAEEQPQLKNSSRKSVAVSFHKEIPIHNQKIVLTGEFNRSLTPAKKNFSSMVSFDIAIQDAGEDATIQNCP